MAGNILHRRSTTASETPASLENGQIAINQADGVLFWKDSSGVIQSTTLFPISAASPTLTGTPTAPTATAGTNNTQIATTAYADTAASTRQAADATLTAVAGVTTAADTYVYFTDVDTAAAGTITTFGRSLIDDAAASDARTTLELGTAHSPQFTGIEVGHATDTTVTRASAGQLAVEGVNVLMSGGALGTPASGTLTNCTGLPVAGITASTSTALGVGSIELGHATDTTLARSSAGNISVEGNLVYRAGGTDVPLADGGTGASLTDPNADRIMFWDDSAGAVTWLTASTGLSISGTTLTATAGITRGTSVATTSGTSIDFTSIPSGVNEVVLMFDSLSTNGTSPIIFRIGDSGGIEATGYDTNTTAISTAAITPFNVTTGLYLSWSTTAATETYNGMVRLRLLDSATNLWSMDTIVCKPTGSSYQIFSAGTKALSGTLDRVRVTTVGGSATFDAGTMNIQYQ